MVAQLFDKPKEAFYNILEGYKGNIQRRSSFSK